MRKCKHGHNTTSHRSPTYNSWYNAYTRCNTTSHKNYKDYGGRGITICPRWADFRNFLADMGSRPEGKTLDRIDFNKGYNPENCRWASAKEQGRNKRTSAKLTAFGITATIAEWAEALEIRHDVLSRRILRKWSHEDAVTEPVIRIPLKDRPLKSKG